MTTPFTRRRFLQSGLTVVSTVSTMPGFLNRSALAISDPDDLPLTRQKPGVPDDRILLVVQLSGGNDGLNTVVPFGLDGYYRARPAIGVREKDTLALDADQGLGLHRELAPLKEMIDDGLASVIQGVGYPNPNRSHFASMDIWHTCHVRGGKGLGWLGAALDQKQDDHSAPMIAIGREAPLAGQGRTVRAVSFEDANLFRWSGAELHDKLGKEYDRINRAGVLPEARGHAQAAFVMRTALDAQVSSDRIRGAIGRGTVTSFPGGQLANQLRMVASMIRAGLPTRVYYVGLGGFDTHAGQPGRHGRLLREFATAMRAFYREMKAMGQAERVLGMAFSEFGRRVAQNASQGTDHGTAGPMFMFGPMIRPGVIGKHPSLSELDSGDLVHAIDFRSVYAAVLGDWMKVDGRPIFGRPLAAAPVLDARVRG